MNGSGLRDETSFYYWENFFDPETFKGRPELLETIMDLGKLDNGQLVTIQEPILSESPRGKPRGFKTKVLHFIS